jgi:hypothetical protein
MATSRIIEEEAGTSSGRMHPHNGYWAGDFSSHPTAQATQLLSHDPRPPALTTGVLRPVRHLR